MRYTEGTRDVRGLNTQRGGLALSLYRSKFIHFEIYDRFAASFGISSKRRSTSK
jgi:hypothetical protein